ncbi:MAG TPA: hypothetical protein V6D28_11195 [Leptolyngbyaceae cyanobacterium]
MEDWEFLIQKEGDRTWQHLQSSEVELPEGRYRIVARSSRIDTEVDLRIVHHSTDEDPPKRRMQKRSRRTNLEGLMVVIPFTTLKAGIWEFRCRPDLISDLIGESWQHNLSFRILPKTEIINDRAENEDDADLSLAELGEISEFSHSHPQSSTSDPQSPNSINQKGYEISTKNEELERSNPWTPVFASKPGNISSLPLLLTLKQQTYTARQGQSLTLVGEIKLPETWENPGSNFQPELSGELRIYLRDPQNGETLAERQQSLPTQVIPFSFSCEIQLPPESNTRLILGEVNLYSATETPVDSPLVLATASFTITADLDNLLSAVADEFAERELLDLPYGKSKKERKLDLSALEQLENPQKVDFKPFQPSTGAILPPLLYQPDPFNKTAKPLDLPTFNKKFPAPLPANKDEPDATYPVEADLSDSETEIKSSEEVSVHESVTELDATLEILSEKPEPIIDEELETKSVEKTDTLSSPTDTAFQSLKLEDRFWSRLNAFAADGELAAELDLNDLFESTSTTKNDDPQNAALPAVNPAGVDADLAAFEIVVDDESLEPVTPKHTFSKKPELVSNQESKSSNLTVSSEEEPIPAPELELPKGELIAGEPVRIRIKMPMRQPRLGVKFWVTDVQTRSLIESTRWIGDFVPDPWGKLEATIYIPVPFGCMEIRFEAIGVEIHTQRESHKTSVDRTIVPPNLPSFTQEEF